MGKGSDLTPDLRDLVLALAGPWITYEARDVSTDRIRLVAEKVRGR